MPLDRLEDLAESTIKAAVQAVRTFFVAKVTAIDPDPYSVSLQILTRLEYLEDNEDDGETKYEAIGEVHNIPVARYMVGDFSETYPIIKGTLGRFSVSTYSLEEYMSNGGMVDPRDPTEFPLDSGLFIPDMQPFQTTSQYLAGHRVSAGPCHVFGDKTANYLLARVDKLVTVINGLNTELNNFKLMYNTHVHPGVTSGPGSTAPTLSTAAPASPISEADIASNQLKVLV